MSTKKVARPKRLLRPRAAKAAIEAKVGAAVIAGASTAKNTIASRGDAVAAFECMPALIGSIIDIAVGVGGEIDPGFTEYDPAINVLRAIVRARNVQHTMAAGLGVYENADGFTEVAANG